MKFQSAILIMVAAPAAAFTTPMQGSAFVGGQKFGQRVATGV